MVRFLRLLRLAVWRAFQHDAFSIAKASAYSSILTFFPALLVVGSILATSRKFAAYLREITYALDRILPAGSGLTLAFLKSANAAPGGTAGHHLAADALDLFRRHDLLDGRLPPLLRAA